MNLIYFIVIIVILLIFLYYKYKENYIDYKQVIYGSQLNDNIDIYKHLTDRRKKNIELWINNQSTSEIICIPIDR